jgi:crotonobetainyl-CoA:carnitine CoA-transferase CaiB-like acyl-CoA transferase
VSRDWHAWYEQYDNPASSLSRRLDAVRTSLLAGMVGVHAYQGTRWTVAGEVPGLAGDHHPSISPYGMFATGTAPVQIACGSEGLWRALCGAFGWDAAEPEFATNALRVANRDALIARIEALFADQPAEHWLSLLSAAGVPSGLVRSMDSVYTWEQTLSQGLVLDVAHATKGDLKLPGSPIRFDDNPYSGGRSEHLAPPTLGQHDESIREWLDS